MYSQTLISFSGRVGQLAKLRDDCQSALDGPRTQAFTCMNAARKIAVRHILIQDTRTPIAFPPSASE